MGERSLIIRTNGSLRKVLRIGSNAGKRELFVSQCAQVKSAKLFDGSELIELPKEGIDKHDVDFTKCERTFISAYQGKCHIGYKSTGVAVAVIGKMKSEFTIPGLETLDNPVQLEIYYPARLAQFPIAKKAKERDILLPDLLVEPSGMPFRRRFDGLNIEDVLGEDSYEIVLTAIPNKMIGRTYNQSFPGDEKLVMYSVFVHHVKFVLQIMLLQRKGVEARGWLDYSTHVNSRFVPVVTEGQKRLLRADFRVIEEHFSES